MHISENHPFLSTGNEVSQIAKLLEPLGVTYFSYHRSYHTGERIYLGTTAHLESAYFNEKYYLAGNTEHNPVMYHNDILLWSAMPNQHIYDALPRAGGVDHGMYIVKPNNNYCDFFSFATKKGNDKIINTYLTKLDIFKSFTDYFLDQASDLIKTVDQYKIILPFNNKKPATVSEYQDTDILNILLCHPRTNKLPLTQRQIECSLLLIQGKSYKKIAEMLKLSTRTVEYYISNIKLKLKCANKAELIAKLTRLLID